MKNKYLKRDDNKTGYFFKQNKSQQIIMAILIISLTSFIIISPQIYQKYVVLGYDISFHYNRFYDLFRQIETGHYNYFQTIFGFDSSGRIINALYGYDFSFLLACLLYVTKSWLKFQIVSSFLSLLISGMTMYTLAKKMDLENKYAILSGVLYTTTSFASYFVRYQSFSGWGAAFLPLIFVPAIRAVKNKEKPINSFFLAIPVAILVNTHIMSAAIGVLSIIPFFLVSFIESKKKMTWMKDALLAVFLVILMSLNTLYSYYEVFSTNNILSPFIPDSIFLESLKLSFSDISSQKNASILFSLIILFTIVFTIIEWRSTTKLRKIIILTGMLFLFLSSPLIPWDVLSKHFSFVSMIQFPSRFSVSAFILLILSFFMIVQDLLEQSHSKTKSVGLSFVLVVVSLSVVSVHNIMIKNAELWLKNPIDMASNKSGLMVSSDDEIRNNFRSSDLTKAFKTISKGTPDYLPIPDGLSSIQVHKELQPYGLYKEEIINSKMNLRKEILSDGRISISWNQKKSDVEILPVIIYKNTTVNFNGKLLSENEFKKTNIGSLQLNINEGENNVVIGYQSKVNIKYILLTKLITVIIVCIYFLFSLKTKKIGDY